MKKNQDYKKEIDDIISGSKKPVFRTIVDGAPYPIHTTNQTTVKSLLSNPNNIIILGKTHMSLSKFNDKIKLLQLELTLSQSKILSISTLKTYEVA